MRDWEHRELSCTLTLGTFHPLPSLAVVEGHVRSREERGFSNIALQHEQELWKGCFSGVLLFCFCVGWGWFDFC